MPIRTIELLETPFWGVEIEIFRLKWQKILLNCCFYNPLKIKKIRNDMKFS